jgi:hypothetical protein
MDLEGYKGKKGHFISITSVLTLCGRAASLVAFGF